MPICFVPLRSSRRCSFTFLILSFRNWNKLVLIPFRLSMWLMHCCALICIAESSSTMIRSTASGASAGAQYTPSDYAFLNQATSLCIATSFLCLAISIWGVLTGRTLRFGVDNCLQGSCHAAATILLVLVWYFTAPISYVWIIFYVFSMAPTALEVAVLLHSYWRGIDCYE